MSQCTFTTFELEDHLYGIDIRYIREINRQLELSPVPHAPEYICGLINLRGQIVTVIDLKRRLGFKTACLTENTHNLIIKTEHEMLNSADREELLQDFTITDKVGLLVDQIGDIVSVERDTISPPPANTSKLDGSYVTGVVPLKNTLLTILSMPTILKGVN